MATDVRLGVKSCETIASCSRYAPRSAVAVPVSVGSSSSEFFTSSRSSATSVRSPLGNSMAASWAAMATRTVST